MAGRVEGKAAIVVGGGQTPGETIGNGRATAMLLAREGARVLVADRDLAAAEETAALIAEEGVDVGGGQNDVLAGPYELRDLGPLAAPIGVVSPVQGEEVSIAVGRLHPTAGAEREALLRHAPAHTFPLRIIDTSGAEIANWSATSRCSPLARRMRRASAAVSLWPERP